MYCQKSKENLLEMCQLLIQSNCDIELEASFREQQKRDSDNYDSDNQTTTNNLGLYCCNSNSEAIDPKIFKLLSIYSKIDIEFILNEADPKIKDEKEKIALDYLTTEAFNYAPLQTLLKGDYREIFFEKEFQRLLKNKECAGFEIHGIKCHKQLIQVRTKQDPEEVLKILEKGYSKIESENVLKWVYGEKYTDELFDLNVVNHLQTKDVLENSMAKSWEEAYFDESKKYFTLSVSWKFDPEEQEEEEEEEEIVEIKIHKNLLIARLGLFREMFAKLEKEEEIISQVTDHSGTRIDTMTIFVGLLYKNKIDTSGDYELKPKVLKRDF
ncbi:hypothetical protein M0812_15868 [Anaeramoeba flamelloides]|uniref:BTB domain-containing protein n=1 Tax=Anaeramoeba flamelloides TaxID=1746091 RepID=A0AAV7ZDN0_9EUKA|nr:hypothetical protein M0812_15868 [Anaeramoeba flamelloides]